MVLYFFINLINAILHVFYMTCMVWYWCPCKCILVSLLNCNNSIVIIDILLDNITYHISANTIHLKHVLVMYLCYACSQYVFHTYIRYANVFGVSFKLTELYCLPPTLHTLPTRPGMLLRSVSSIQPVRNMTRFRHAIYRMRFFWRS